MLPFWMLSMDDLGLGSSDDGVKAAPGRAAAYAGFAREGYLAD